MSYVSSPNTLIYQSPYNSLSPSYQHNGTTSIPSSISMPSLSSYNQYYETLSPSMLMLPDQLSQLQGEEDEEEEKSEMQSLSQSQMEQPQPQMEEPHSQRHLQPHSQPLSQSHSQSYSQHLPHSQSLSLPPSLPPSTPQLAPSVRMERAKTTTAIPYEDLQYSMQYSATTHPYHQKYNSTSSNTNNDYITNINTPIMPKRHSAPAPSTLATERTRSNSTSSIYNYGGPVFQTPLRRNNILSPSSTSTTSSGLMTPGSATSSSWGLYKNNQSYSSNQSTPMTPSANRSSDFGAGVKLSFTSTTPSTLNGSTQNSPQSATTMVNTPSTGINPFYKPSAYIQQQTQQNFSSGSPISKKNIEDVNDKPQQPQQQPPPPPQPTLMAVPPPVMGSLSGSVTPTSSTSSVGSAAAAAAAAAALEVQSYSPPLSAAPSLTSSEPPSAPNSPDSPNTDTASYSSHHLHIKQDSHSHSHSRSHHHQQTQPHLTNYSLLQPQQLTTGSNTNGYQFFDTPANLNPDGSLRLATSLQKPHHGRPPKTIISSSKPHRCPDCMKSFRRLEHLKRHAKIHTEERPFTCDIAGCSRKFSRSDNLRAHRKTHMKRGGRNIYIEGLVDPSKQ